MTVLDKLATSLGKRAHTSNVELAKDIVKRSDKKQIGELVENLKNKNKSIQFDCIKVLYECGDANPQLISGYFKDFIDLLENKNNNMIWGAMHALDSIALENPKGIYSSLTKIIRAADEGSVITRDHAVSILIKLCSTKQYADNSFDLLIEQIKKSPTNQLPMYAENAITIINDKNKLRFIKALTSRLDEIEKDTKRKRVERVIKKLM